MKFPSLSIAKLTKKMEKEFKMPTNMAALPMISKTSYILRLGIIVVLLFLIAAVGASSFYLLQASQIKSYQAAFDSSADQIIKSASFNVQSKVSASQIMSQIMTHALRSGFIGPAPNMTYPGFEDIMMPLAQLSNARGASFHPILDRKNRHRWESYAAAHVDLLGGPSSLKQYQAGGWTVSMGIYNKTNSGAKFYDNGYTPGSEHPDTLTPVWQICPIATNAAAVMLNVHSMKAGGRLEAIDRVLTSGAGSLTDFVQLVQDTELRPSSIWYYPVIYEGTITALTSVILSWDMVFQHALPSFMSGVDIVLSSATQTFTLHLTDGVVQVLGAGDLHDKAHESDARVVSEDIKKLVPGAITDYTITIYPTSEMYNAYVTVLPLIISQSEVGAIILTTILVLLYMYLVSRREQAMMKAMESSQVMTVFAKEELEIKKQFVRYIAHEIRTPLSTVKMGLEILKQDMETQLQGSGGEEEAANLRSLGDIYGSCLAALEVVNDFLLFDKIVSNKLALELAPVNFIALVNEVVHSLQLQARRCGTVLTVINSVQEPVQRINTDRYKVTQVLRNMLSNALKFTPSGGRVSVLVRKSNGDLSSAEHCYVLDVSDTGVGISKENQTKLFERIVQFNPGKLQAGGGSGLGMYISHGIMTQLGGSISVHSDGEGLGTTFTMKIPLNAQESAPGNRSSVRNWVSQRRVMVHPGDESCASLTGVNFGRSQTVDGKFDGVNDTISEDDVRILVVDDAATNRKLMCRMLRKPHGYHCKEACDGREAVEQIKQSILRAERNGSLCDLAYTTPSDSQEPKPFDAVLMDYTMPQMSGPEAAKAMRDLGYRELILGVTGHSDDDAVSTFLASGANHVLLKPVEVSAVVSALNGMRGAEQRDLDV